MENGEAMARPGQTYPEATAQIVMQAFLQRVVNGGGTIIGSTASVAAASIS